jgi:tripartite-type tricarboxylate transporter receptor subunit TctC
MIVPFAAGGPTDVVARIVGEHMSRTLGQQIIVENVAGAGGTTGITRGVQSAADGYTLMMSTVALHAINPGLFKQKFDPLDDFSPIAFVCSYPMIMIASPQTTFRTLPELKSYSAGTPTFYSSSVVGSPGHLSAELLRNRTGMNLTHVPYKGGSPSVLAIMSSEAQLNFATLPAVVPQIRGGKVRAIALASKARNPAVPDVPTMGEWGVADFEVGTWSALIAPKGVPADVVQKINAAVNAVLADPTVHQRLVDDGAEIVPMSAQEFSAFMRAENARWVKVVKDAGIKPQ